MSTYHCSPSPLDSSLGFDTPPVKQARGQSQVFSKNIPESAGLQESELIILAIQSQF